MDDCPVRPLTPDDLNEALELLDMVFVKPCRKGSVYDWTPTLLTSGNAGHIYAAMKDGRIVSVAGFKPLEMRYRGIALTAALIGSVATHPNYRRRGYSGKVLECMTAGIVRARADFSALWSASPDFYRGYGWESAGVEEKYRISMAAELPDGGTRELAGEYGRLQRLREQSGYLHTVRTEAETRLLLENSPIRRAMVCDDAYAVYERVGERIDLLETGGNLSTLPVLVSGIGRREGTRVFVMQLSPGDPRPPALHRAGFHLSRETRPAAMFRMELDGALPAKLAAAGVVVEEAAGVEVIFGSPGNESAPLAGMCINWLDHV